MIYSLYAYFIKDKYQSADSGGFCRSGARSWADSINYLSCGYSDCIGLCCVTGSISAVHGAGGGSDAPRQTGHDYEHVAFGKR